MNKEYKTIENMVSQSSFHNFRILMRVIDYHILDLHLVHMRT